jgi:hypothetical protein
MKSVKLLKTIVQGDMGTFGLSKKEVAGINPKKIKRTIRRKKLLHEFIEGNVVSLSDTSAQKYVDNGWGEIVTEEKKAPKK